MNLATVPRPALWAAGALLAWLLLVIAPLSGSVSTAENSAAGMLSQWTQATGLVQKLEDARGRPAPPAAPTSGLLLTVKGAIATANIPEDDVHGLQEVGGTVKVDFIQVPGDLVVRFLFNLQSQGLVVQQWDMSSVSQPGIWTATGIVATP